MRRGEIWAVAGGVYASKPWPAVIIQDDRFDATSSVTVCPMSTVLRDAPLTRVALQPTEATGLAQPSEIMVDRITTVRRSHVGQRVGKLTKRDMIRVEQSLLVFLGVAG